MSGKKRKACISSINNNNNDNNNELPLLMNGNTQLRTVEDLLFICQVAAESTKKKGEKRQRGSSSSGSYNNKAAQQSRNSLAALVKPLQSLVSLVGMEEVKKSLLDQMLYFIQGFHEGRLDMLHTVIEGPPGVGKTRLAEVIACIYQAMGVLDSSNVVAARRSDLIGKYLGHTADKTQKLIDQCKGGVLLIDEAYSLGDREGHDSFSKECIDTLNQNLTEARFMCIIAGYKDALQQCFFSQNEGLARRFVFRFRIKQYSAEQLRLIFLRLVEEAGWKVKEPTGDNLPPGFFTANYSKFPHFGGDMETLLFNVKMCHSRRFFHEKKEREKEKKSLTHDDLSEGFKAYTLHRAIREDERSKPPLGMYI